MRSSRAPQEDKKLSQIWVRLLDLESSILMSDLRFLIFVEWDGLFLQVWVVVDITVFEVALQ